MSTVSETVMKAILQTAMESCVRGNSTTENIPRSEVLHLARMCAHVYNHDADLSGGWVVSDREVHEFQRVVGSYVSELYERDGKFVLAFAGTADFDDVVDDVLQLVGASQQYSTAATNAQVLVKALGKENIFFIGHSLGGGLAQAAALSSGVRAITFNPAWLTKETIKVNKLHKPAEIVNYVVLGEALDVAQRCGKSFLIPQWSLPEGYIAPSGTFVFLQWPPVQNLPKGPLTAHRMCAVIEALETDLSGSSSATNIGKLSPVAELGLSLFRSVTSDTDRAKGFLGLASKAVFSGAREKYLNDQGGGGKG